VSKSATGRTHDKKLYDASRTVIPRTAAGIGDTGYVGTRLPVPYKKPRNGALTAEQKRANRALSRRRIAAEHGIGKMKFWRIASDRYRNPLRRHTVMMKNVAGLHNAMFG
jgi:DDE superfamily endonuclease